MPQNFTHFVEDASQSAPPPPPSTSQNFTHFVEDGSAPTPAPSAAPSASGEGTYPMWDTAGHKQAIHYSQVPSKRGQGYQFDTNKIPERGLTPQDAFNRDYAADPARENETGLRGAPTAGQMISRFARHPLNTLESLSQPTSRPANASALEIPATDLANVGSGGISVIRHPIQTASGILQSVGAPISVPVQAALGQRTILQDTADQIKNSTPEQAAYSIGQGIATAGAEEALPTGISAAKESLAERNVPVLSKFARNRTAVPNENFTPIQAKSHAAVIAEGSAAGDTGYIPKDIAQATSTKLRETAAANPNEIQAIQHGSPEDAFAAHQSILQKAKAEIDQRHETALAPVADRPVDMTGVQKAIQPTKYELEGMDPTDAKALTDLQQRAGQIQTLRGLNEFRQQLATEDTTLRNPMAQGKSALYPQSVRNLYGAVRDAYYDALEKATGKDFQADKRLEGNIIQEQRGALSSAPRLTVAEAKEGATLPRQTFGDIVEGTTRTGQPGIPIIGGVASKFGRAIRGTKLGQIQQHLQRFYSDLPEAPTADVQRPIAGQLPAANPLPPARQLESNVPANVEPAQDGASSGEPYPPRQAPSTITPAPDAIPQLTAQAGPQGSVVAQGPQTRTAPTNVLPTSGVVQPLPPRSGLPQLGAGEGNPEFVTPPPSPPPAVNVSTSRTQVSPTLAERTAQMRTSPQAPESASSEIFHIPEKKSIPSPTPKPKRAGFTVSPEGTAIPQRPQLAAPVPSPATHEFSKSAWQAANPKRNLTKAVSKARALGFKVVD